MAHGERMREAQRLGNRDERMKKQGTGGGKGGKRDRKGNGCPVQNQKGIDAAVVV